LEGKDELALWGQVDAKKCILKVQAGKELCLSWDKAPNHVWFGTTECKVTVTELTALEVLNWPEVFSSWFLDRQ
jgi:hypothetical protein